MAQVGTAQVLLLAILLVVIFFQLFIVRNPESPYNGDHVLAQEQIGTLNTSLSMLHAELLEVVNLQRKVHKHHEQRLARDAEVFKSALSLDLDVPASSEALREEGPVQLINKDVAQAPAQHTNEQETLNGHAREGQIHLPSGGKVNTAENTRAAPISMERVRVSADSASSISSIRSGAGKRAVIFTMDSITSYEEQSRKGGAAGEILIRSSLERALKELGVSVRTVRSDAEFDGVDGARYDFLIVDPWTWAAKGWVPKHALRGHDSRVFVLDFFGSKKLRGSGLDVPPARFLTAFGSPFGNAFLGYSMKPQAPLPAGIKKRQGIIWGKDPRHFYGKENLLRQVADALAQEPGGSGAILISTATIPAFKHDRVRWVGHQTPEQWMRLLRESKFLIGLGDPLLGPSAIDAISAGCMYINPQYSEHKKGALSQHSYAETEVGAPYVCNYKEAEGEQLVACVRRALSADLEPLLPPAFVHGAYMDRVRQIFSL